MPTRAFINRPIIFHDYYSSFTRRYHASSTVIILVHHHLPSARAHTHLRGAAKNEKRILFRRDFLRFARTSEWKVARTCNSNFPLPRFQLRPWGERYYKEEHSFLTKGTTCSAFAHVRPLLIETTPTVLRRGGDSSGVRFIASSSTLFSPTRHRENSTMHATKIVTGENANVNVGGNPSFQPFFFPILLFFRFGNFINDY